MKFQKKDAYQNGVDRMLPTTTIEDVAPKASGFRLSCIGCDASATLIHRGTAYCRPCYDKRNYNNTLVN